MSKSKFSSETGGAKLDMDDPLFWQKVMPDFVTPSIMVQKLEELTTAIFGAPKKKGPGRGRWRQKRAEEAKRKAAEEAAKTSQGENGEDKDENDNGEGDRPMDDSGGDQRMKEAEGTKPTEETDGDTPTEETDGDKPPAETDGDNPMEDSEEKQKARVCRQR